MTTNEPKSNDRPLLILDLDETLIRATEEKPNCSFDFELAGYFVICRPFLARFLSAQSLTFDIAIWSSGTRVYVEEIVRKIMPSEANPVFVWSRSRCSEQTNFETNETFYVKDLSKVKKLGYKLQQTLIVEDCRMNVQRHYGNAIYVDPFLGDPADNELLRLGSFLAVLSNSPDFRVIEKRSWKKQ